MNILLFTICFIISFIISSHVSGHYEGHKKEQGLYFTIAEYSIHIHHYLWTALLIIVAVYFKINIPILYGLLAGATLQGLTYRDRFIFIYKTKDFEKIYSHFESSHWGKHLRAHTRRIGK